MSCTETKCRKGGVDVLRPLISSCSPALGVHQNQVNFRKVFAQGGMSVDAAPGALKPSPGQGGDPLAAVSFHNQSAFIFVPVFLVPVLYLGYKLESKLPNRIFYTIFPLKYVCVCDFHFDDAHSYFVFYCQNRVRQTIFLIKCYFICTVKALRTSVSNALLQTMVLFYSVIPTSVFTWLTWTSPAGLGVPITSSVIFPEPLPSPRTGFHCSALLHPLTFSAD